MRKIFGIILILNFSCQPNVEEDELNVINDTFLDVVGNEFMMRIPPPPPPPPPIHPDSILADFNAYELNLELGSSDSLVRLQKWRDEQLLEFERFDWKQYKLDLSKWEEELEHIKKVPKQIIITTNDSLTAPFKEHFDYSNPLSKKNFNEEYGLDDTWRKILVELLDSNLNSKYFDPKDLTKTGSYQLETPEYNPGNFEQVAGEISFSRVALNGERNKACYYYTVNCGIMCGYNYLIFAEKKNSNWRIINSRMIWTI